jgi:thymidylate synthase (FAD)
MSEFNKIPVLDAGYLLLVEKWGSDQRIIESARMSTNKGFLGWGDARKCSKCGGTGRMWDNGDKTDCNADGCVKGTIGTFGDEKLLRYLWTKKHSTPFEFCGLTIEVQAPIMVFREWMRHRTQSYSEMSARYTPLPDTNYLPSVERLMTTPIAMTRQAMSTGETLDGARASLWLESLRQLYDQEQLVYQTGLDWGVPKELARLAVSVGRYSRMRASANLRNWFGFLTLRLGLDVQAEMRAYAVEVSKLVATEFPRTYELFREERER